MKTIAWAAIAGIGFLLFRNIGNSNSARGTDFTGVPLAAHAESEAAYQRGLIGTLGGTPTAAEVESHRTTGSTKGYLPQD